MDSEQLIRNLNEAGLDIHPDLAKFLVETDGLDFTMEAEEADFQDFIGDVITRGTQGTQDASQRHG